MTKKEIIAQRLIIARQNAGLSQGQVAKIMNLHRPTISEIEAGRRSVSANELLQFGKIYGVKINWLTDEADEGANVKKDSIELAARELSKLKDEDFKKVLNLLNIIRGNKGSK
jgi:transcriptional regulator with XRE-family HTH domain